MQPLQRAYALEAVCGHFAKKQQLAAVPEQQRVTVPTHGEQQQQRVAVPTFLQNKNSTKQASKHASEQEL